MAIMTPIHILEVRDVNGVKEFINRNEVIDRILLHPEVRDRKIVVISIIGEYRKGKSFFLGYCLRFLYANVSSYFLIITLINKKYRFCYYKHQDLVFILKYLNFKCSEVH